MKSFQDNSVLFYTLVVISIILIFVIAYANTYISMDNDMYVKSETFIPNMVYASAYDSGMAGSSSSSFPSASLLKCGKKECSGCSNCSGGGVGAPATPASSDVLNSNSLGMLWYESWNKPPTDGYSQDVIGKAQGSLSCPSFGLTNSKGPLCLNEEQIRLYTTRGGNASETAPANFLM